MALSSSALARAASFAIDSVSGMTGSTVNSNPDGSYDVVPTPAQITALQGVLESASSGPSTVNFGMTPVFLPFAIKKAAPWVIGILAITFFAGRFSVGRKKVKG